MRHFVKSADAEVPCDKMSDAKVPDTKESSGSRNRKGRKMQQNIHGGDIYSRKIRLDFSVNGNPLGMPDAAAQALREAVRHVGEYPDITAGALTEAVSRMLSGECGREIPKECLLFGNGASEIFLAAVHGLKPRNIVIPVPSFYGYEYAAEAAGSHIKYVYLPEGAGFRPGQELLQALTADTDLLFLANPNNPTGQLMNAEYLQQLLEHCRKRGITVVLDECFIEFCETDREQPKSLLGKIGQYENLLLVRAFTKSFAMPGVRLGYLVCSNAELREKIRRQLPEWNLSAFAQRAGIACAEQAEEYLRDTVDYVKTERTYLREGLEKLGIRVVSGEADFLLLYTTRPICDRLLEKGILIRNCENFRGLGAGYYRIAVKKHEENEVLLQELA